MKKPALLSRLGSPPPSTGLIRLVRVPHALPLVAAGPASIGRQHDAPLPRVVAAVARARLVAVGPQGTPARPAAGPVPIDDVRGIPASFQAPPHRRPAPGPAPGARRGLVRNNRDRTVAWTARAATVLTVAAPEFG